VQVREWGHSSSLQQVDAMQLTVQEELQAYSAALHKN